MVSTRVEGSLVFSLLFLTPQNMFAALQLNPIEQKSDVTINTKTNQNRMKSKMPPLCTSDGTFSLPKNGKKNLLPHVAKPNSTNGIVKDVSLLNSPCNKGGLL